MNIVDTVIYCTYHIMFVDLHIVVFYMHHFYMMLFSVSHQRETQLTIQTEKKWLGGQHNQIIKGWWRVYMCVCVLINLTDWTEKIKSLLITLPSKQRKKLLPLDHLLVISPRETETECFVNIREGRLNSQK